MIKFPKKKQGIVAIEWPKRCKYWYDRRVHAYLAKWENVFEAIIHGCAYGLTNKKGEALLKVDFAENKKITSKYSDFANKNCISLPVRLHDFTSLSNKFNFTNYEFHFSYKEIEYLEENGFESLIDSIENNFNISIHLPDYISKDNLIDPFNR